MAAIYNAMNPDLSKFKARGGKLLMYHGLADPIVTPQNTLDYYAAAEKAAGGSVADSLSPLYDSGHGSLWHSHAIRSGHHRGGV